MDRRTVFADFEQRLGSDLAGIATLAAAFSTWAARAALAQRDIFQVSLALEELVTNVIRHGLGVGGEGWIELRVARCADCLAIELRDNAPPFDPFQAPPPALGSDISARPLGGLGVHLVRTLMDGWSYAREGDQNVVSLHKLLGR